MPLQLINGKFFDKGNLVPLQFGNKEQVKLIEAVKQLREEGAMADLTWYKDRPGFMSGISLQCVCGERVRCEWEKPEQVYDIEGTEIKCSGCDFTYRVCSDDYDFLYFKLI